MKTFTTYAEKKAKQFLNLLQGYTKGIRMTAILILLLMGVSNAWAYDVKKPHVYFNATNVSSWPGVNIVVGHDSYSYGDLMSTVSNTNLYYAQVTFNGTDANGFVFIGANSKWGEWNNQSLYNRTQSQSNRTDYLWFYNTIKGGLPSGTYYFSTSGNKQAIDYSQYTTIPTFNTTSAVRVRTGTSGTYSNASGTYPANISIQGTYISNNGKTNRTSITSTKSSDGNDKKVYSSVITGLVTLSYSNLNEAYTFDGWGTSNSNVSSTSTNYEFNQSAHTTVYAFFTKKTYTITYKQGANGSGSIDAGTKEHGVNYTLSSNKFTRTGYTQTGWSTSDGGAKVYDLGGTYTANTDVTLYPFWTPNQYTITLNANGGASNGSATATYNSSTITNLTHPTRTDYRCNGYYTAASGGTLVLNIDGTLAKNVSGYTDANGNWTKGDNATLYAQWTYDVTEYTVTFGAGTGFTSYGSVTAYNNTTSASITSPAQVQSQHSVTFTATPKTGYIVEGWYTNAACTAGKHNAGNTTYTTTITAATNVYVKFVEKTWSVAFAAGTGGTVTTPSSTPQTVGEVTGINIIASPSTGYSFKEWTSSNGGLFGSTTSASTTFHPTAATTVTANFTENLYAISVKSSNENFGTVSPQSGSAGIDTEVTITATPKLGYKFVNWTATNGITIADANSTTTTITASAAGTVTANFSINNYTIIYNLNGGTNNISNPASYTVETETITLQDPTKEGFLFVGWYTNSTFSGTAVTSITKGSTGNKTLCAKWLDGRDCIFFYNNLGWSNVYVYFYNNADGHNYWADGYGTGANKQQQFWDNKPYWEMEHGTMTQIKGTNIWYYYATYIKTNQRSKVSFANVNQSCSKEANNTNSYFQNAKVVYRADLDYEKRLPMFVPHTTQSHYFSNTKSTYYNHGYWMNYPTNTGYKLHIFDENGNKINDQLVDIPFEYGDNTIMPWSVSVSLEGAKTYAFKIQRADNQWYGNNGTMTTDSSGDVGQTAWEFTTGTNNCKITTTAPGTYVFTLNYGKDAHNNYNYLVGVEYPASVGDYRLAYQDDTHPFHPGHLLKKRDGKDTVSFFVHHNLSPVIMLQQVTAINATTGDITWQTISTTENLNGISATGIYNFILEQSGDAATLLNTITEYDGDFYIRTDATAGGWGNFRQKSNKMTYTSYAENQDFNFNHYFVEWINAGTNVKFTIANEYSYCLSDSLNADDIVTTGNLPANANVRFGWNSKTNELSRAYISGSSNASDRFLVLTGNEYLLDIAGKSIPVGTGDRTGLNEHELIFSDKQNWIYQLDVQANNNTEITLTAEYNNKVQTFFGTSKSGFGGEPIMQATNDDYHKVRMIYDFKTNNLIAAWLLDETQYPETTSVASNMLIIREDQGDANQINFTNIQNQNMEINTAYAVMTFTKDWVTGATTRDRSEYWVSFPFDVKISDVFGFSEYGDKWIMQLYDGAERAEKGNWIDSPTFWKYITNRNYTLEAGVGYVLKLNLSKMTFDHGATDVSLFFPSQGIPTVINAEPTPITIPAHECTIERDNRNIYDSHWNLIGVPGYAHLDDVNTKYTTGNQAENVSFYYAYNAAGNNYAPAAATADFKNMYAYMVQFAGTIDWKNDPQFNNIPQQLAARRNSDTEPEKVSLRLEIAQDEVMADQTFVQLQQEGATPEFDMNLDLTKIINSGANIYTLAGEQRIQSAGNALPMGEAIVPVGVKIDAEGEYTFRMPDGTEGMVVELIDYERDITTNLLLFDYTVTLPAGSNESRFALHIQPNKSGVTTGVENVGDEAKGIEKYLIDGKLIIRTAEGVFDAQGKRL